MFKIFSSKKEALDKKDLPSSSEFSDFFRKASSRESKRVFLDVAKKASAEQKTYVQ